MISRRQFLLTASSALAATAIGCDVYTPENLAKVQELGIHFEPKPIVAGAIFTLFEIETDSRFITEHALGISENLSRIFRFREHTKIDMSGDHPSQLPRSWKPGVIVDEKTSWRPWYIELYGLTVDVDTYHTSNYRYMIMPCEHDVDAEVHELHEHIKYMRATYRVNRVSSDWQRRWMGDKLERKS